MAATYLGASGGSSIAANTTAVYTVIKSTVTETRLGSLDDNLNVLTGEVIYPLNNTFSAIALADDAVLATGSTRDADLPTTANAYDPGCGTDGACNPSGPTNYLTADIFVARYSLDLQTTHSLTYFGGSQTEDVHAIDLDAAGNVLIAGSVVSSDLPTSTNAHDRSHNGADHAFVARFDPELSSLLYVSYLGGNADDAGLSVWAGPGAQAYVAGSTGSANFPTSADAFDSSYNGGDVDTFASLFDTGGNGGTEQRRAARQRRR